MILWWWMGCGGEAAAPPAGPSAATAVRVVSVVGAAATERLTLSGAVEAEDSAEVVTEAAGPVAEIGFDHGQKVARGDVLLKIRAAAQNAAVAEAEARHALAVSQLERTRGLADRQNASKADLDKAVADVALAAAQLDRAREEQRKTWVRAPFDGVVGLREVSPGEVVGAGRVVTRIEAVDRVVVDVDAPERWLPRLAVGLPATVSVDALPGEGFSGEVIFVGPRVEAGTRTARVRVRVPNPDGKLRPGLSAEVEVTTGAGADTIWLPAQAVVASALGNAVWVVKEGTADRRPVELGERTADQVRIVSGLAPGDQVVVEGLIRLRPGSPVRVAEQ